MDNCRYMLLARKPKMIQIINTMIITMPMQIMSTIEITTTMNMTETIITITIIMNMIEIIVTTTIIIIMITIMLMIIHILMTIIKIMSTMKMVTDKLMRRITHLFYLMMTKSKNNKKLKINIHTIVTESLVI